MARPLRIDFDGAWHHVMNRGARRQLIYLGDDDHFDFLGLMAVVYERFGLEINAYCFMGNHYHLLVKTPEGNLSRAIKHIDGVYAQRFNKRHGVDGPLFKGRFRSKLVDTDGYLDRVARYIHRNPLEANLVDRLDSYPWSSYPSFLARPTGRPDWISAEAISASGVKGPTELRRLTEDGAFDEDFDIDAFPAVIGSDSFIEAALLEANTGDQTVGHCRKALPRPSFELIERHVASAFGRKADSIRDGASGVADWARTIAIGLSQEAGGCSLQEIADRYGFSSAQSAGAAVARFRKQLGDPRFSLAAQQVRVLIDTSRA